MELTSVPIDTQASKTLPMKEAIIMPISDVQYGVAACDVQRFKRHIQWGVDHGAYYLGLGDYVDFASPSNRGKLTSLIAGGELYDTVSQALEDQATETLGELEDILRPTRGRWLGLTTGHHGWKFMDGTTTDMRLAGFLGASYLGDCGLVNVEFKPPEVSHRKAPSFTIWAHHGRGNGQLQSAPLNKLERMAAAWDNVDVFLMAHHHKKVSTKLQRVKPVFRPAGRSKLVHRNVILACTGGFLKGYMAGNKDGAGVPSGTYVEKGMMNPVALGGTVIWARPRFDHDGYAMVDLDISL